MFPCLGFLVADPSCSYRAPLFSLASALLQRSCEQLQPYVGNGSTPCRPAFIFTHSRVFQTYEPPASGCTSYAHHRLADCPPVFPRSSTRRGFEPQTAAWSSSRWRELRASPTDSRHISYVQSHSIELNRSDLDFWPAHCGVTSHLWLHGLLTPAISGSTTRSSTLQARPGASLFVDTLIPPMRACALLVERRSASRGQHFCRRGVQMQLQTAPLHSAPSWRWPPPWRTNPAASCATSAC